MDNWIDVNDRLPDSEEEVLLWVVTPTYERADLGYLDSGKWVVYSHELFPKVTHWMPFPNPPKTDKQ
jgi:hypothetical protein